MFFRSGCKGLFVNKPQIIPKGRTAVSPCVTTFSFSQFQACSTPCESHGQAGYQLIFYFERTTQVFINVQISDWIYYTCEFSTFSTLLAEQTYSCDNWTCWSEADEVQQDIATCCLRSGLPLKIDLPVQVHSVQVQPGEVYIATHRWQCDHMDLRMHSLDSTKQNENTM